MKKLLSPGGHPYDGNSDTSALKTGTHVMVFADQVNGARVAKQIVVTSAAP